LLDAVGDLTLYELYRMGRIANDDQLRRFVEDKEPPPPLYGGAAGFSKQ